MISRTRLIQRISLSDPVLWLIDAGAGFGKTVLLDQLRRNADVPAVVTRRPIGDVDPASLATELASAARRAGLDEIEAAIVAATGHPIAIASALAGADCCLLVDAVDSWDHEAKQLVSAIVHEIVDRVPCVLAGRSGASFAQLRQRPQTRFLTSSDLTFTAAEVAELVRSHDGDEAIATVLHSATQGWPLAVASLASRVGQFQDPAGIENLASEHENMIDGLLRSYLDNLSDTDIEGAVALAELPFFDDPIAELVGSPGLVTRLSAAGVPVTRRADGWLELAEQFRQSLRQRGTSTSPASGAVLDHYVDRGEINAAISLCLATGNYQAAVELIAGLSNDQQTRLEPGTLNAAIATLGDSVEHAPRCLLVQGLVNGTFGRMDDGVRAIERAVELFAVADPDLELDAHREARLELGLWCCFTGQIDRAWDLLETVAAMLDDSSRIDLRARTHDLRGLLFQIGGTEQSLEDGAAEMTEALRLWRSIAEPRPAAATVFRLAGGVLADLGQRGAALDILENLPNVGPMTLINRARLGLERSALLPFLGRASEVPAIVAEVRRLAGLLGHEWIVAWSYWTEIVAASVEGRGERVEELIDELDAKKVRIGQDHTETNMWCDIAEACARCGLYDRANAVLARTESLTTGSPWVIDYAKASIEARCGDEDMALGLVEELDLVNEIEHERRWRIELVRSVAFLRKGNTEDAEKHLDRAFELAADLGQPRLPNSMESGAVQQIRAGDTSGLKVERIVPKPVPGTTVSLFGEFQVNVDGEVVYLPRGQVPDLIKLIVLGGGSLIVDQVIDRLWPDASLDVGRRRLRNLLGRLRESCPDLVERVDDRLQLGAPVTTDFLASQQIASQALADSSPDALDRAIDLNRGELLPEDRYEDWAEQARTDQRSLLLRLLDAKAAVSERDGDVDATVSALMEAHELDSHGRRKRTAAELLRSVGRDVAAAAVESADGSL